MIAQIFETNALSWSLRMFEPHTGRVQAVELLDALRSSVAATIESITVADVRSPSHLVQTWPYVTIKGFGCRERVAKRLIVAVQNVVPLEKNFALMMCVVEANELLRRSVTTTCKRFRHRVEVLLRRATTPLEMISLRLRPFRVLRTGFVDRVTASRRQ